MMEPITLPHAIKMCRRLKNGCSTATSGACVQAQFLEPIRDENGMNWISEDLCYIFGISDKCTTSAPSKIVSRTGLVSARNVLRKATLARTKMYTSLRRRVRKNAFARFDDLRLIYIVDVIVVF